MKKIITSMKKSTKISLATIVIAIAALISGFVYTAVSANSTAPKTIQMGPRGETVPAFISNTTFGVKTVSTGEYAYCIDYPKLTPANQTMYLIGEKDAGYAYFVENGYPKKNFTGDRVKDYYITQVAVWWYIDDTTGTKYVSDAVRRTAADPHGLRPHIKSLVAGAKSAKARGYATPSLNVSLSGSTFSYSGSKTTYYSSAIKVTGTKVEGRYSVSVSGVKDAYVTDLNGVPKTAFLAGESFKVAVPYGKVTELNNKIMVSITATGKVVKAYAYKPQNDKIQSIVPIIGFTQSYNLLEKLELTLSTSKLTVYKKDSETKDMLAGAKLALYDMNDVLLKTWTSSAKSLTIAGLVPGKYYIRELEAPEGYNMIKQKVEVQIDPAEHKHFIIYNIKEKQTQVTFVKRDKATSKVLPGAKLVLKDDSGEVISTWISSDKGRRFTGLPEGNYTISELEAPSGYKLLTKVTKIKLVAGKAIVVDIYNEKKPKPITPVPPIEPPVERQTKLRVAKYDIATGLLLSNAKLAIKNEAGKIVAEWTTDTKEYYIEGLAPGKYTLVELEAPSGYALYPDAIPFELIANDMIQDLKMYNTEYIEVPPTDVNASTITLVIGTVVMAAGGILVFSSMKKRNA